MLARLVRRSLSASRRSAASMLLSVAAGTAVVASFAALSLDIEGRVARELRSLGANISVEPRAEGIADLAGERRFLRQEDLVRVKTVFWRHNIVGISPFLDLPTTVGFRDSAVSARAVGAWERRSLPVSGDVESIEAGLSAVAPWWSAPPGSLEGGGAVLGSALAARLGAGVGDVVAVGGEVRSVTGVITSGGDEDDAVFVDLDSLQRSAGLEGSISRAWVSALTTPMDDLALRDPRAMTPTEYEKWYCTAYVTSIALQVEEAFEGSRATPVWRVAHAEGDLLRRLRGFVWFVSGAAFLACTLGMSATMTASHLGRRREIAILKSLGADRAAILRLTLAEAALVGSAGGAAGYAVSAVVTDRLGMAVFGAALSESGILLPLALGCGLAISLAGSWGPLRRVQRLEAAPFLREIT